MIGKNKESLFLALSLPLFIYLGYFAERSNAFSVILPYAILFILYFFYIKKVGIKFKNTNWSFNRVIIVALLLRTCFLFTFPSLSDDVYRFIWDGHILLNGLNPYLILPSDYISSLTGEENTVMNSLFDQMNSPNYFTVYPPVLQGLFGLSALISPGNIFGSILFLKLVIILSEAGTIYLIHRILKLTRQDPKAVIFYAFNPLVITELTGNLHMEAIMLFFLAMGIYFILRKQYVISSFFWAIAICSKIIPLMLLIAFIPLLGWRKSIAFYLRTLAFTLMLSLPFISQELILRFFSSIDLYFRSFEFNASIYYLVREIGWLVKGYNPIHLVGPLLAVVSIGIITTLQIRNSNTSLQKVFQAWLYSLSIYLIFATTIHPWYLVSLVFVSVFCQNIYFGYWWSALAVLSYHHYHLNQNEENYFLIAMEYLPIFILMIIEFRRRKQTEKNSIEWKL